MIRLALLLLVPLAPAAEYLFGLSPLWVFLTGIAGIAILAEWIRAATDALALHTGPAIGGLLTISLGSLAELILALFVLMRGEVAVVHAQITGSIMGTCLLGLGLAIVVGGFDKERQSFKRERAGLLSSMMVLVVIALVLPAVFDFTDRNVLDVPDVDAADEALSLGVSVVLLALYAANLVYTLVTHRNVFAADEGGKGTPRWSALTCLFILGAATAGAALESELVSSALTDAARTLGLTPLFVGVVVLALVGTCSDIFAAVWFAHKNQMGLVMNICIGSGIQIALVVAPLLVLFSWALGAPMTLVFQNPLDLFSIVGTALIVRAIAGDGETTWFEGVLLIGVYIVLALAYFFS